MSTHFTVGVADDTRISSKYVTHIVHFVFFMSLKVNHFAFVI